MCVLSSSYIYFRTGLKQFILFSHATSKTHTHILMVETLWLKSACIPRNLSIPGIILAYVVWTFYHFFIKEKQPKATWWPSAKAHSFPSAMSLTHSLNTALTLFTHRFIINRVDEPYAMSPSVSWYIYIARQDARE